MSNVLNIRDKDGNFVAIPAISGADGKSAYEQAVEGGFAGTEEEFIQILGSLGGVFALQLADTIDAEEHIADKNNPHGVTAAQVRALPTTGGIMSGSIKWNDGKQHIVGQGDGNLIIQNYKQSEFANDDFLAFHNTLPLQNVLRIYRNGTPYDVYGKHNKPTASDVGAVAVTGGTMSGSLNLYNEELYPTIQIGKKPSDSGTFRYTEAKTVDIYNWTNGLPTTLSLGNENAMSLEGVLKLWIYSRDYIVFGEHNKPTKSYTGNGGNQTVQIGGLGIVAWLVSSNGLQGYVSKNGFMGMNSNGQASNQVASFITFENGVLTLNNGGLCNASGIEYTVQVL